MNFYLKEELRVPVGVGVAAFSVGVGVGYTVCNRRWRKLGAEVVETMDVATDIIEAAADETNQLALDFANAARDNAQTLARKQPPFVEVTVEHPSEITDNSPPRLKIREVPYHNPEPEIEYPDDTWNQEEEEAERGPDAPYVISKAEFDVGETGFAQTSLEFFAGDNVLCDDKQVPIYNPEKIVGRLEFGRGSGDSDLVYIRNEALKSEWEVTRNHGSYQVEVLGLQIEEEAERGDLKHSNAVLRFRD